MSFSSSRSNYSSVRKVSNKPSDGSQAKQKFALIDTIHPRLDTSTRNKLLNERTAQRGSFVELSPTLRKRLTSIWGTPRSSETIDHFQLIVRENSSSVALRRWRRMCTRNVSLKFSESLGIPVRRSTQFARHLFVDLNREDLSFFFRDNDLSFSSRQRVNGHCQDLAHSILDARVRRLRETS